MNQRLLVLLAILIGWAQITMAQQGSTPAGNKPAQQEQAKKGPTSRVPPANDRQGDDCGCELTPQIDVLAVVNGVKITVKDVEESIKETIIDLHQQVTEARKRELDLQINTKLLSIEATKRGVSSAKLIDQEVVSKIKEPTETEARVFYDQRRAQIQGDFNTVKGNLIDYLRTQRQGAEAKKLADSLRASAQVKVLIESVTPPKNESERARVFATVNGEIITSGDIEDSLRTIIFNVQEQAFTLRKQQLDLKINNVLLEQEAQKRKVTTTALLDAEVRPRLKNVTEEDARAFYEQNKDKLKSNYEQLKVRIVQHLQKRAQHDAELTFAEELRGAALIQIFITPPEQPVFAIATDDQPTRGEATAPITIVEFTDYECPTCAKIHPIIEKLVKEYASSVRWVVRDFPLQTHANAFKAAEAAEAAREQGRYWEYVAILFQDQTALSPEKLKAHASKLGLDRSRFDGAVDAGKFADRVQRDLQDGIRLGIVSTPTVFVNGRRVTEKTRESLKAAIESALKNGAKK